MTAQASPGWAKYVPHALVAFGAVSFLADVAVETWFYGPAGLLTPTSIAFNAMALVFTGGITAAGVWLGRSGVEVARYPRVAKWTVGFSLVFLAINLFVISQFPDGTLFGNLSWALWAVYVGGLGGVIVGTFEARAIHRAVEAERKALETEHLETQRQWLDYLNSLLRHEVLNNASIIQGYASLLEEEDLPSPAREYVETIDRQSRDMTDVIGDVRVLVRAVEHSVELQSVDVVDVIADELEDLRATHADVEWELSTDDDPYVLADDLLPRIFSNLLSNAVEHNPDESPRVAVDVETRAESVRVEIADDGPGVADEDRETLFERGQENHGLGLYLVHVLADRYGGRVELVETGPDGSVFAIELPRGDPPADEGATPEGASSDAGPDGLEQVEPAP
ncbi:HAMP domain-containing histidine kinase [Natronomonas salina]|uniref:sensor histidine kinase n=1 Tax=Natronomonas salina TaxID=1710540 RepID=UPI0015B4181A|nr:HAMP domain-containing sensor histidine kinase [Natronomonas salina]QLD90707.1 HAMP domain-containing histidine kinase [Natronomonas salina]